MKLTSILPLLATVAVLAGCREDHSWHQKLTVVVDTPQGEVSGSSVVEVRVSFYSPPQIMSGTEVHYDLTGEATVVEVLPGRYLFALIGDSEELFARAAKDRFKGMTRGEWLRLIPSQTEPVTLTSDLIPMLVTFTDLNDPITGERVSPGDLTASFGPGVGLKAVSLEITSEQTTVGRLDELLPWLDDPRYITNPGWAALPNLIQEIFIDIRSPIKGTP